MERRQRQTSETVYGRPIQAGTLVASLPRPTVQGNGRHTAGLDRSPSRSDSIKLCKMCGDTQQRINHPTVQNRVEMAAIESPTIYQQMYAPRQQFLDLLAGR